MKTLSRLRVPAFVAIAGLVLSVTGLAQTPAPVLDRKSLLGGRLSMLIPADFKPLSEELLKVKYPSANRPSVVYSNAATTINVALDHTAFPLTAKDLVAGFEAISGGFKQRYASAQWFRNERRPINGRDFFLIEIRTAAVDTEIRNLIVGTSLDDRLLLVTFNVVKALETAWMPIGNKIIESIAIK